MKTTINTKALTNAVAVAATYTSKNGDMMDKGLFSYEDETTISIKTTDFVEAMEVKLTCQELVYFDKFALDLKRLLAILKIAKNENTTLEFSEKTLIVKNGKTKAKIDLLAETPIITADPIKKTEFVLTKEIISSLKSMEHSIDAGGSGRVELTGMLMKCNLNVLTFVGTDTRRLCIEKHECTADDFEAIIPKNALKTFLRCTEGTVVSVSQNDISIQNETHKYFCKLINSKYIEYSKVIPASHVQTIMLEKKMFVEVLKEASALDTNVMVDIKDNKIKVKSLEGNLETERDFETGNADISFAITAKYALDYLAICEEEKIQIGFNGSLFPLMFIQAPTKFEIIMPINTNTTTK